MLPISMHLLILLPLLESIPHTNTASTLGPSSEVTSFKKASLILELEKKISLRETTRATFHKHFLKFEFPQRFHESVDSVTVGLRVG